MSIAEDYFDLLDLPDSDEDGVWCRYCDEPYLTWGETADGWRLFDSHGRVHSCHRAPDTADFGNMDE